MDKTLVERLRSGPCSGDPCFEEAANRIEKLEAALKPFAEAWVAVTGNGEVVRSCSLWQLGRLASWEVSGVHFQRARAALNGE